MNTGNHLEALAAFVEERMLPEGYAVKTNQRIYNDDEIQMAEFDIEIRGRLGTTEIAWLGFRGHKPQLCGLEAGF